MTYQAATNKNNKLFRVLLALVLILAILSSAFGLAIAEEEQISEQQASAVRLAAGFSHSAMIDYDGSLYLWGDNTYGQSAAGSDSYIDQPQLIELGTKATEVSLGAWHTLVLTENGDVYSSGRNTFGQLGNGTWENSSQLTKIPGLSNIAAIEAGSYHSLALGQDGSLWVWGSNTNGQLAHAASEELKENEQIVARRNASPERIIASGISQIAAGGHFTLYADQEGKVFSFGDNSKGQLGIGTTESSDLPIQVADIENAIRIEAGYEYALAIVQTEAGQEIYAWGDNSLGQLGIGQPGGVGAMRTRPSAVKLPADLTEYEQALLDFTQLTAGYSHVLLTLPEQIYYDDPETKERTYLLSGRQHLLTWGSNAFGQLGASASTQTYIQPNLLQAEAAIGAAVSYAPFDAIAAGGSHSLVMSSIGQLAASGRGNQGQLGTVSIIDRSSFTAVETEDHILPAWGSEQYLTADFNDDDELVINWQPAQNNRNETLYRLEIKTADGKRQLLECGDQISRTIPHLDPAQPLAITVFAYDAASEDLPNDRLSLLYGSYLPEDYIVSLWSESFDQPISGAVQNSVINQNWTAAPTGLMVYPAVPWKQTADYDTRIVLSEAQKNVPIASIVIMVLSALLIIMAAVWLAINFHKERSLIYPLVIPAKIKTAVSRLRSGLTEKFALIIRRVNKTFNKFKAKKKAVAVDNSEEFDEVPENEKEVPVDNSAETSDIDK